MNRFFSTLKQAMDNIDKVRMELGHKYYALAETQPDLKVDLFSTEVQDIDLNRIQRVSVFKSRQEGAQCVATIDGKKLQPRSVTPQQWQRMWLAEDRNEYKRNLAATLFADVLRKGQTQEETAGEKQVQEDSMRQNEEVVSKQVDASIQESDLSKNELPVRDIPAQVYERYEKIKAEQPETVVLLKHEGKHYASMYDAETVAHELSLPPEKERLPYDPNKLIVMFEHDNEETRKHIAALKAYVLDCDTAVKEGQEARADITDEQSENEQRPSMRR